MKRLITIPILAFVAGCSGQAQVQPQVVGDLEACSLALLAGASSDPVRLLAVAATAPACQGLAADVIQQLVQQVSVKQRARGLRQ